MSHKALFIFETLVTQTAAKLFVVRMHQTVVFQTSCCTETLWTIAANIRPENMFMLKHMILKVTSAAEFLLTNVTGEPSTFIV